MKLRQTRQRSQSPKSSPVSLNHHRLSEPKTTRSSLMSSTNSESSESLSLTSESSESSFSVIDATESSTDFETYSRLNFKSRALKKELAKLQVVDHSPYWDKVLFGIVQSPLYIITAMWWVFKALYLLLVKRIKPAGEREVFELFFNTSLALMAKPGNGTKDEYLIQVDDCQLKLDLGEQGSDFTEFRSWKMVFKLGPNKPWYRAQVKYFSVNGEDISTDFARQFEVLFTYLSGSMHFKTHSVSEPLMREIEDSKLVTLYPSLDFTRTLNATLLNDYWSPLNHSTRPVNGFPVVKESGIAENLNYADLSKNGLEGSYLFRRISPFYSFLWKLRPIVLEEARKAGLNTPYTDYFFIHSVVHSLDHYNAHQASKNVLFSIRISGKKRDLFSCWTTKMFCALFLQPLVNPLYSYRMKNFPSNSVYGRIYKSALEIDPELAGEMTAGTMF